MNSLHLTEDVLQLYALEPERCPQEVIEHLAECEECRVAAEGWMLLGKALKDQPAPEFSFDVAAAVMGRLEGEEVRGGEVVTGRLDGERAATPAHGVALGRVSRLVVPGIVAIVAGVPAWLFRKTAYFAFADMSEEIALVILVCAGVAVAFSAYKYYRRYQQIIQLINR